MTPVPRRCRRSALATLVVAACYAATFVGSSSGNDAPAAPCARSTKLSFVSERSGREQIYLLDIRHAQRVTRVTRLPGFVGYPTWSPNGRRLAFMWLRPGATTPGIYVAESNGPTVRLLVDQAGSPAWSPNGQLIAYTRLRANTRGISVVHVERALRGERSAIRDLTRVNPAIPEEWPAWSPDGKRIAFTSQRSGSSDIWVLDRDGSHLRNLTPQPSLEAVATWSPDGKQIVFGSDRAAHSQFGGDLFRMNADGGNVRRLTFSSGPKGNYGPAWSPDGRWIAFNSQRDGNSEVYLMRPDGTRQRRVTYQPRGDAFVTWVGGCRVS
jgi:TolB protein